MVVLTAILAVAAALAGTTGTWSPCGLSSVETIACAGERSGRSSRGAAALAFALGALVGGAVAFGGLALVGAALHGTAGSVALGVAAALAALAAVAEARGVRVVPQVRRQVPERWRRALPLPVATGGYGVLLGLGVMTFVLTWAVWALLAVCLAVGDPVTGLACGLAFGAGRAVPLVVLALRMGDGGEEPELMVAMGERPELLRRLRRLDGLALGAAAAVLAGALLTGTASAAGSTSVVAAPATDPSLADLDAAWQQPGGPGILARRGRPSALPGTNPALGGGLIAWREGTIVVVARRDTLAEVVRLGLPGAEKLAVSDRWLVARFRLRSGARMLTARRVGDWNRRVLVTISRPTEDVGRPALWGDTVAYDLADGASTRIRALDLATGRRSTLRAARGAAVGQPALRGDRLLYVRKSYCWQELRLGATTSTRGERVLRRLPSTAQRDAGHEDGRTDQGDEASQCAGAPGGGGLDEMWTTALGPGGAWVTEMRPSADGLAATRLVRVGL
jgi:hypothetical protein